MIGTIMIVRTMIAVKYPVPTVFGGPKSGILVLTDSGSWGMSVHLFRGRHR